MELTQDQIQQLKSKGLTDEKISSLATQNGYTMPKSAEAPKVLTISQVSELKSKGLNDEKIQSLAQENGYEVQQPNWATSLVQSVAKPALKIVSSIRSIPEIAKAKTDEEIKTAMNRPYNYGGLGAVSPIGGIKEAVGVGAELGSYAIGGGGTATAIKTGLKGKILQGAYQGLKTGAAGGGTVSFGQALQEAENKPSDIAYKTLFGTVVGGVLGGGLGAVTPVVIKGTALGKKVYNLRTLKDIEPINKELNNLNTEAFKPTAKTLEKWSVQGKDPIQTYTEIFGKDIPEVGSDNRFTKEGINDAIEKVNNVYNPAAEGFNTILRNSPEVNSISKAEQDAIAKLAPYNLTPEMETRAVQRIQSNFQAIKDKAIKDGVLLGDDSIPVWYSDNLKDKFWKVTKNFGTEDATISNAVNSSIGHGFKDAIENSIDDINVKNYNKHLGDLIVLRDFLETKIGSLAGTGGKMTRLTSRIAGSVIGAQGGPITAIMGNITGDKLAQIMINPAMQPYRWLINKKLQQLPQAQVLKLEKEANDVLQAMFEKRMSTLALPEAQSEMIAGKMTPVVKNQTNPIILGGETTFEKLAQSIAPTRTYNTVDKQYYEKGKVGGGVNQPLKVSDKIPPITKPIKSDTKKNISK